MSRGGTRRTAYGSCCGNVKADKELGENQVSGHLCSVLATERDQRLWSDFRAWCCLYCVHYGQVSTLWAVYGMAGKM